MIRPQQCPICDQKIIELETDSSQKCVFCGTQQLEKTVCPNNHFICKNCLQKNVVSLISDTCLHSEIDDPIALSTLIMKAPAFKMHCPEHHFLVPAVLLSVYSRQTNNRNKLNDWLKAAQNRASKVPGAFCGTHGSCGAAIGTGIFVSITTGATPFKTVEWKLANEMTARALLEMAQYGGPRCCKRVTYLAIQETANMLKEKFETVLNLPPKISCSFSSDNEDCLKENCPFFPN